MKRLLPYILPIGIALMVFLGAGCSRTDPEEARLAAAAENKEVVKAVAEPYQLRQTLYYNGDIITMAGPEAEYAEAFVQREGRIVFVGSKAQAVERFGGKAEEVDLAGKTLLPGFIDAHGHLKNVGFQALAAYLLPPPDSDVDSIAMLQEKLVDWGEGELSQQSGWIVGFGYDNGQLAEQRHPTRDYIEAQSVQNGPVETRRGCDLRIRVDWVDVAVKPVQEGLILRGGHTHRKVRVCPGGWSYVEQFRRTLSSESSLAPQEELP